MTIKSAANFDMPGFDHILSLFYLIYNNHKYRIYIYIYIIYYQYYNKYKVKYKYYTFYGSQSTANSDCDYEEKDELQTLVTDREGWKVIARYDRVSNRLK